MKVDVTVERTGHNWCAYAPGLDDIVVASGATREEAMEGFRRALRDLLDYKREAGRPLPEVTELVFRERAVE